MTSEHQKEHVSPLGFSRKEQYSRVNAWALKHEIRFILAASGLFLSALGDDCAIVLCRRRRRAIHSRNGSNMLLLFFFLGWLGLRGMLEIIVGYPALGRCDVDLWIQTERIDRSLFDRGGMKAGYVMIAHRHSKRAWICGGKTPDRGRGMTSGVAIVERRYT